jgi:flagellar M-ring protein FliF
MPDFINKMTEQITQYWNKFSTKNKIQIISALVIAVIAFVVLAFILSQPTMVKFADDISAEKMSEIKSELDAAGITYEISSDATTLYVDSKSQQDVSLIAANLGVISDAEMTYDEALTSSITSTTAETTIKIQLAFEDELNRKIEMMEPIENAYVKLYIADDDSTIFDEAKESSASVIVEVNQALTDDQINGIVNFLHTGVKNLEKENISITSTDMDILYDGKSANGVSGSIDDKVEYKMTQEQIIRTNLRSTLLSLGQYNDAEVTVNLEIDFDEKSSIFEDYSDGTVTHEYENETEGSNTDASGVPGTDSNDGVTDYDVEDSSTSESSSSTKDIDYMPDKTVTSIVEDVGEILYDESSVTVVLNKFNYIYESSLESQGLLEDITFDEYKNQNNDSTELTVPANVISLVQTATKIDDIQVLAYEIPMFIEKDIEENILMDYLPIIVIVLLIILLGYAVYKGTEPAEITEEIEPELSVEDMLATTKEKQELEEIEFDNKSQTRVQIEKFVEENPEAVALLLRNWLNEDWE